MEDASSAQAHARELERLRGAVAGAEAGALQALRPRVEAQLRAGLRASDAAHERALVAALEDRERAAAARGADRGRLRSGIQM